MNNTLLPLVGFAQAASYEITPTTYRLPPFLWTSFTALNNVHGLWRWYRRAELYTNPDNLAQLLSGHVINLVLGDVVLLRVAAQCLLIATRILECSRRQKLLYRAGQRWLDACKGNYPRPCRYHWEKKKVQWGSPSFAAECKIKSHALWNRIERIAACTLCVFLHLFQLSMCVMDAVDAFCLSPYTRNEGINEGVVNAMKWLDHLVENKEELLEEMATHQALIERILKGSAITYRQLHNNVVETLEKTEVVYKKTKAVFEFQNGFLKEIGKRMIEGARTLFYPV